MSESIKLNIVPNGDIRVLHVSQHDISRTLIVELTDGSGWYSIPSGATVEMHGRKPSGLGFTVAGTFSGHTATFNTVIEMTDEPGRHPAEIRISKNGQILGSSNFILDVERNPHPGDVIDGTAAELDAEIALTADGTNTTELWKKYFSATRQQEQR